MHGQFRCAAVSSEHTRGGPASRRVREIVFSRCIALVVLRTLPENAAGEFVPWRIRSLAMLFAWSIRTSGAQAIRRLSLAS